MTMTYEELKVQLALGTVSVYRRYRLTTNKTTSSSILELLSTDILIGLRKKVAAHQNTSKKILKKLAQDSDEMVRAEVARNINTPLEALMQLSQDRNIFIRRLVLDVHAHRLPKNIVQKMCNDSSELVYEHVYEHVYKYVYKLQENK